MTTSDIINYRLYNQQLISHKFKKVENLVSWFGAVQSQDYPSAKWALAQRISNISNEAIEKAFNDGKIIRTHVMRPTWHFIAPEDTRWMLELSKPQLDRMIAYYGRQIGFNEDSFKKGNKSLAKILEGGKQLTRSEMMSLLKKDKIGFKDGRDFGFLVFKAEVDGIICSGPRIGRQFTYVLLEERIPKTKELNRDESLAELTKRYFTSHGPAQIQDFGWWSGLPARDIRRGIEVLKPELLSEIVDGKKYYFSKNIKIPKTKSPIVHLLPNYDEYTIAYRDRSAIFQIPSKKLDNRNNIIFNHTIIINGTAVGGWRKNTKRDKIEFIISLFKPLDKKEMNGLQEAVERYGKFVNMPVSIHKLI